MHHVQNDGRLDVLVLGPMGANVASDAQNCVLIKKAIEDLLAEPALAARLAECGYHSAKVVAPEHLQGNRIANEVFRELDNADLAVLDLSSRPNTTTPSPNVMYELALVHALGLPSILVSSTGDASPFYVAHDRVHAAVYQDPESIRSALRGPLAAYLNPQDKQNFADNVVSSFYEGAALIDISAAAGLAAGYYDNFVQRVLRQGNGYLKRGGPLERLITVLPSSLELTAGQQIEELESVVAAAGYTLETAELKSQSDIRGLSVRHVGPLIIDLPSTLYALRRSPRLDRHLQGNAGDGDVGDAERKTHQRLLQQFRRALLAYIRRDRALLRESDFECITVAALPGRLASPG